MLWWSRYELQQPPFVYWYLIYAQVHFINEHKRIQETFQADIILSEFIRATQQLIDYHLKSRAPIMVPLYALRMSINTCPYKRKALNDISKHGAPVIYFWMPVTTGPWLSLQLSKPKPWTRVYSHHKVSISVRNKALDCTPSLSSVDNWSF